MVGRYQWVKKVRGCLLVSL